MTPVQNSPTGHVQQGNHTHEIRDADGMWIWRGQLSDMEMFFGNLSGANFTHRPPEAYTCYVAWMRRDCADAWPGRADPYAPGKSITLAIIGGAVLRTHLFPA